MRKRICILGSTGSIGTQALQVIDGHPDLFEAYVLTANRQAELLVRQARKYRPAAVVIADESKYALVRDALADEPVQVYAGAEALCQVTQMGPVDVVLTALVGFSGLRPTLSAIEAGKCVALANKETLVVAGELVMARARERGAAILPVDSEHSAIFQSLLGQRGEVERLVLTASGGPFRAVPADTLRGVTPQQALRHPNWDMGAKITVDSATMMNKGFEVIEARWLFDVEPDRIQVVVHPQSILHSAVQFSDGAVIGQLGAPDMRVPIQLALSFPERLASGFPRLDWWNMPALTFERPDLAKFRCLALAYEAIRRGGAAPCVLNAANEVANLAFREGRCGFLQMADVIEGALARADLSPRGTAREYAELDRETRRMAEELL